jgi:hypothetical protein
MTETRKNIRVTIPLELLTDLWDTRTGSTQNLDNRIVELVTKGLNYQQFYTYGMPHHTQITHANSNGISKQ